MEVFNLIKHAGHVLLDLFLALLLLNERQLAADHLLGERDLLLRLLVLGYG
jgi:hypothetical protein